MPGQATQVRGYFFQHLIADQVSNQASVVVINFFEVVDVEQNQGVWRLVPGELGIGLLWDDFARLAVAGAGQLQAQFPKGEDMAGNLYFVRLLGVNA